MTENPNENIGIVKVKRHLISVWYLVLENLNLFEFWCLRFGLFALSFRPSVISLQLEALIPARNDLPSTAGNRRFSPAPPNPGIPYTRQSFSGYRFETILLAPSPIPAAVLKNPWRSANHVRAGL